MMKSVALICVLLAVATDAKRDTAKISLLKDKVLNSAQQFSFDGFKDKPVGIMSIKVDIGHPQSITLTKEMQQPKWQAVVGSSPLKVQGYNQWMSVNGGMVFKNDKSEMVECMMSKSKGLDTGKVLLDYKCKPMDKVRFAKVKATYWVSGQLTEQDVPSGWDTRWGPFDYPFYTTTSQGILGCKNTSGGYCTPQHADLFPFESCYSNINEAGEAEKECAKKKKEKKEQMDQLEKEVKEEEKSEDEQTAEFFGKNYKDADFEGMKLNNEMKKQQEHQEKQQE